MFYNKSSEENSLQIYILISHSSGEFPIQIDMNKEMLYVIAFNILLQWYANKKVQGNQETLKPCET
jgi:hypothetical protein